jgi:hypothetical protein
MCSIGEEIFQVDEKKSIELLASDFKMSQKRKPVGTLAP